MSSQRGGWVRGLGGQLGTQTIIMEQAGDCGWGEMNVTVSYHGLPPPKRQVRWGVGGWSDNRVDSQQ